MRAWPAAIVRGTGIDDVRRCRTTFTCDIAFTVRTRSRAALGNSATLGAGSFFSTVSAPALSARIAVSASLPNVSPVITTIGVGVAVMISRVAANPSRRGMSRSIVTTSGRSRAVIATASSPSQASPTTSRLVSPRSDSPTRVRAVAESSTTRTRMVGFIGSSGEIGERREQVHLIECALHEICVRACLEPTGLVFVALAAAHQYHGKLAESLGRADSRRQLEAVEPRHLDVADDEIGAVLLEPLPSRFAVGERRDFVAG